MIKIKGKRCKELKTLLPVYGGEKKEKCREYSADRRKKRGLGEVQFCNKLKLGERGKGKQPIFDQSPDASKERRYREKPEERDCI